MTSQIGLEASFLRNKAKYCANYINKKENVYFMLVYETHSKKAQLNAIKLSKKINKNLPIFCLILNTKQCKITILNFIESG